MIEKGPDPVSKPTFLADWAYVLSNWANCATIADAIHFEKLMEITWDMSREVAE